jgi:ribokinase
VDRAPGPGETRRALGFHTEPGGKGLNVAIALQRLGMRVTPVLAHGQDTAGHLLRELLQAEGLSLAHVHALPMASGWGAGLIEPGGENRIAVFPGANDHLSRAHVAAAQAALANARVVYGQFEAAPDAVDEAMRIAHRAGVATVLNPSPWQALAGHLRETVRTHIVNEGEAAQLLGTHVPELPAPPDLAASPSHMARRLDGALHAAVQAFWRHCPGAHELVVTLGAAGSAAWQRGTPDAVFVPGQAAAAGGSTVGCGDAFSAGFCWARAQGAGMARALQAGNHCGARLAAHAGVLQALPTQPWLAQALGPDSMT